MKKKETAEWYEREIERLGEIIDILTNKRMDEVAKNIELQSHLSMCRAALAELQGVVEAIADTADLIKLVLKKSEGFDLAQTNQIRTRQ